MYYRRSLVMDILICTLTTPTITTPTVTTPIVQVPEATPTVTTPTVTDADTVDCEEGEEDQLWNGMETVKDTKNGNKKRELILSACIVSVRDATA